MKKNLGAIVGLYPTVVTVIGVECEGRVNWLNICHVGLVDLDKIMLSMNKRHFSNDLIKKSKAVSVNLIDAALLVQADYVGLVSGRDADKSRVFDHEYGILPGVPLIKDARLAMECEVVDDYETKTHDHFVLRVVNTRVDEDCLTAEGRIDYEKVNPVLFERVQSGYLGLGKRIGQAWNKGKSYPDYRNPG